MQPGLHGATARVAQGRSAAWEGRPRLLRAIAVGDAPPPSVVGGAHRAHGQQGGPRDGGHVLGQRRPPRVGLPHALGLGLRCGPREAHQLARLALPAPRHLPRHTRRQRVAPTVAACSVWRLRLQPVAPMVAGPPPLRTHPPATARGPRPCPTPRPPRPRASRHARRARARARGWPPPSA